MSRRPSWELLAVLRFVLAGIVLSSHIVWFTKSPPWWSALGAFGGKTAVVGFLLVSGYSISASLERDREGFYRRRLLRVYPLYLFTIVFATVLEHAAHGPIVAPNQTFAGLGWRTTIGNLLFLQTFAVKPVVFAGPVWSLAIEVFYYALAPLFASLPRRVLVVLVVASGAIFVLPKHDDLGVLYMILRLNAFRYAWCWLLGFMIERELDLSVAGLALAATILIPFSEATPQRLAPLAYLVSLAVILGARRLSVPQGLRKVADYLGDLSYPLYLFHLPSFILGCGFLAMRAPGALAGLAFAITVAAYHLIDRQLKPRVLAPLVRPRRAPAASVSLST